MTASDACEWLPITYREFYDVPRVFVVERDELLLFDCPFSEEQDDYPDEYSVAVLEPSARDCLQGTWTILPERTIRQLGRIPVVEVEFDDTKRRAIRAESLSRIRPEGETARG